MWNVFLAPNLVSDKSGRVRAHHAALVSPKNSRFCDCKTKVYSDCCFWNMRLKVSVRGGMMSFGGECVSRTELGFGYQW